MKKKGEKGGGSGIRIADGKRYVCVCACVHVRLTFMWKETIEFYILDESSDGL